MTEQAEPASRQTQSDPRTVGSRLRAARLAAGLSQAELAGSEFSPSYVSLIESGRRNPTEPALAVLAERLGTTPEHLLRGQDPAHGDRVRLSLSYAELALRNGNPGDALAQVGELLGAAEGPDPATALGPEELWRARRLRARALEGLGHLEEALRAIEPMRAEAAAQDRHQEHLRLTVDAVRCSREAGDVAYALDIGEAALELVRRWGLEGSDIHAELASTVLGCYYERGDLARAARMASDVLEAVGPHGSAGARAAVYWNASLVAERRDDLPAALSLAERALAAYSEGEDVRALARLRTAYGWLLLRCMPPRPAEAREQLQRSREALREVGSAVDVAYCETELGRAAVLLGEPAAALALTESAVAHLGEAPRLERAHCELVRARALLALDRGDEAVAAYRHAAGALSGLGLSRDAAAAWRELADAFAQLGLLADAALAYQQALTDAGVRAAPDVSYEGAAEAFSTRWGR